ncbi:FecR family protein [Flavivirga eckloniae]|uniref:Anti-sigma factor n=1 Tax=Flavivirga eckloniae TaxID=1803846 RepID=A0A2K9PU06_9FLAO|nr:FecR family protein [Flavivirga eckloniae]AUP80519.1 anti-sigma factor [Flavivirga eckloniae]
MKNLEPLIIKYLEGNLTHEETEHLKELLEKDENKALFKEFVHLKHLINSKTTFNYEKELNQFKAKANSKGVKLRSVLKYAAAILIFISGGYFFLKKDKLNEKNIPVIVTNNTIQTGTDKAVLTLANGSNIELKTGQEYKTEKIISDGKEITYLPTKQVAKKEIAYNTLTVPRGGQFFVKLSDNTKVWLNSESQIKYPETFIDGATRQVELIYGEAYFEVSPSTAHRGSKFKVLNQTQEIEVLGTEFNLKAYKDETHVYTTLVEGKVAINLSNKNEMLAPGEQSNLDIINNDISIYNVDVNNEVSWKFGYFGFEDKPLKDIMKVLSRWYDIDVVFENKALENILFFGKLKKGQSIENILNAIKSSSSINSYEINNKTVIIK